MDPRVSFASSHMQDANTVPCDVGSEAEERVLLIEKKYVLFKVRVFVTETVENR